MKVVILAGGFGTRISEESHLKAKPMVEIANRPILWHIMKIYSHYGFNEFVICCGYKGVCIKEYFEHYFLHEADVTFDFRAGEKKIIHDHHAEPWCVTLVDTGLKTMTGGRIKRIQKYIGNETFMLTYGDGVSNVNIKNLLEYHRQHGKIATVTAVQPTGKFGALNILAENQVQGFSEKPKGDGGWINGGFFVLQPEIFDYIGNSEDAVFEENTLRNLAINGELQAYKHSGFWQCMDTLRDKEMLETEWKMGKPRWRVWENDD